MQEKAPVLCRKCGSPRLEGHAFCASCGSRLSEREWLLSLPLLVLIVLALLITGAIGSWFLFGSRHPTLLPARMAPQPAPEPPTPIAKPSPAVIGTPSANVPAAPSAALPAHTPASVAPGVPASESKLPTRSFGPFNFRLPARQRRIFTIPVAASYPRAALSLAASSRGGFGPHLRVIVFRDSHSVYDSQTTDYVSQTLQVTPGTYVIVVENNAIALPRDILFKARLAPFPNP